MTRPRGAPPVWLEPLTGLLIRNIWWKLFALLIAVAIWLGVAGEPELATIVSVPVEYRNYPRDLDISSPTVGMVSVETRGPSGRLSGLQNSGISAVVDFASVKGPGERTFTLTASEIILPRGVQLIRSVPSQLRFTFENHITRRLPVKVPLSGRSQHGIVLEPLRTEPADLMVGGPQSHVMKETELLADPLDITPITGDAVQTVTVYSTDPEVRLLSRPQVKVIIRARNSRAK